MFIVNPLVQNIVLEIVKNIENKGIHSPLKKFNI